jgi:hypothetical protein
MRAVMAHKIMASWLAPVTCPGPASKPAGSFVVWVSRSGNRLSA